MFIDSDDEALYLTYIIENYIEREVHCILEGTEPGSIILCDDARIHQSEDLNQI